MLESNKKIRGFNICKKLLFIILFHWLGTAALAQGTLEDYQRAINIQSRYSDKSYDIPENISWLKNQPLFTYENPTREGNIYMLADVEKKRQNPAFDHERMAETLSDFFKKPFDPKDLKLRGFSLAGDSAEFTVDSARVNVDLKSYQINIAEIIDSNRERRYWGEARDELANEPETSPDKKWLAYIRDSNIYIKHIETGEDKPLSYDGSLGNYFSSYLQWSPDSKMLAAYTYEPAEKHHIYFVESSPEDQLQPKLQSREYLKPGDAVPQRHPRLFDVSKMKEVPTNCEAMIMDQFRLSEMRWDDDSKSFTFEYNQRGHQQYKVIRVDTAGKVTTIINEFSPTFIDYSGKKYRHDLQKTKEIIWASERDGWNHLYLYDGISGKVKHQITSGEWLVRDVIHVDEEAREILFAASGYYNDQDPYLIQYFRIGIDGKKLIPLTKENASHHAYLSDNSQYFADQYSRIDEPPVTVVRDAKTGKVVMDVQQADLTALQAEGWKPPEIFTSKARDGKTDIWGIIVRPSNFDPTRKYPVIEYIYAGPHSSFVPKTFRPHFRSLHSMAELGFIVVQMDGMGTSNRSKAFHDVCYQNIKDSGFPDRKLWLKDAAAKYPYMDIGKVGIYGTSAGGQSAAGALIFHGDFYNVAVSSCGCHDNRMDKIWWNEQWMGKIGPHYGANSNVDNASQMQGNLMLILGEVDDNVDPASTYQLVDALVKSKKEFELVVIPGMGHSSGGEFGERKRKDFFVKHLMGVDPPSWDEIYNSEKPISSN